MSINSAYPTLDFGLGETIEMLRQTVYEFSAGEIAPRATEMDESNSFPRTCGEKWVTWVCWV